MNRNWLTTVGVGILLGLILLFVVLASCSPDDEGNNTGGQPGPSASAVPSGSLPPDSPSPVAPTPSGTLPPDPGETDPETEEPTRTPTDPVSTRTPSGGVDAGGGSGVSGRKLALLVTGAFLLTAAMGTAGYAFRRPGRG
ncbi:hypothetical protein OHA21_01705 [Actinoplanes sp. NBC_00393]|uniref:hypothetical protein n=1 Tax=Actinoplanes sp. NBC_00393 TaxID=2975953 RepID=UPI002E1DE347